MSAKTVLPTRITRAGSQPNGNGHSNVRQNGADHADERSMLAQHLIKDGQPNWEVLAIIAEVAVPHHRIGLAADLGEHVEDWINRHGCKGNTELLAEEIRQIIQEACCGCPDHARHQA